MAHGVPGWHGQPALRPVVTAQRPANVTVTTHQTSTGVYPAQERLVSKTIARSNYV